MVLDYGRKIGDGTPDEVRSNKAVIDAYLGVAHNMTQVQLGSRDVAREC